jgi:AraC-like DNA-binding protein
VYSGASESVAAIRHLIRAAAATGLALDEGPTAGEPALFARIAPARAHALWAHAVRALGPALPLAVAGCADDCRSLLYFAAMACQTLGEALELAVAHWRYVTDAYAATCARRAGAAHLRLEVSAPQGLGARVAIEYQIAALVRAGRELAGGGWQPSEVVLGHRPPVALAAWEAACGAPVRVADRPGLVIAEAALALPVRSGLSRSAGRVFRELLAWYTPRAAPTVAGRVAAALGRDLGAVAPTVERLACELGLSARSLHRQLAAEGTSYQRVLDQLRRDEAIRQAVDAARPFKAIAAAVGFGDPRAFRRAFKRWTGATPRQFRRRGLGEPVPGSAAG